MASVPWYECLLAVSEAIDQGLHVIDQSGVTVVYNTTAASLDGVSREEALGKHVLDVFPSLNQETSRLLLAMKMRQPLPASQQTYVNYKGRAVTCINSTYPLIADGRTMGAFELMTDVTSLAETTDRLVTLVQARVSAEAGPPPPSLHDFDDIVTSHPGMLKSIELARRASHLPSPVFVYGDTGTGKELIVQAIHKNSKRPGLLVEQNCAALPETLLESTLFGVSAGSFTGARDRPGLLELAKDGTLYLDEINSMPNELQAKLLRALQDNYVRRVGDTRSRPTAFRVIASSNVDPIAAVESGTLRADLFYRLSAVLIDLPPLSERKGDLPLLVRHFLARQAAGANAHGQMRQSAAGDTAATELSAEVWDLFESYSWPGNVRELQHVLEHASVAASGPVITADALPAYLTRAMQREAAPAPTGAATPESRDAALRREVYRIERSLIVSTLRLANGNVSEAARHLGVARQTLQSKMNRLGISREEFLKP